MALYSYKGQNPEELPHRIRLDDGTTRTSLQELNLKELNSLGFVGPIIKPNFDKDTQKLEWNGDEYEVIQLSEIEVYSIEAERRLEILKRIDYNVFWNLFENSKIYKKLNTLSLQSVSLNSIYSKLITLLLTAKSGSSDPVKIQHYINSLFLNCEFTLDEVEEFKSILDATNLNILYTLPDEDYISSHTYIFETDTIIGSCHFKSWTLVNGKWEPPVEYPTDGKVYNWNEDLKNWVEL